WVLFADLRGAAATAQPEPEAFFENRIRPVLAEHCYECHDGKVRKGNLELNTREGFLKGGNTGPAVIPGDPGRSLLIKVVRHEIPDFGMPAKKPKLSESVINDLSTWIKQGAVFPSSAPALAPTKPHWAFQAVSSPAPPKIQSPWSRNPIDLFILEKLSQKGVQPAAAADKHTLLRRAAYDLTGLPPSASDRLAFEQDPSPDAFLRAVDRLLASKHYGEKWARHWLDLVRYADTAGETADYPVPLAWKYRNWVIDAFNSDKPYNEFLREQIAGDILAKQGPRERYAGQVTATGYLAISRRFGFDSENYHHLTIQDTIDTLGQTVLGLTLGCARCHAHKYDPVSMQDYYALYGIFESTRYAFPGSEQKQRSRSMVPLVPPTESLNKWREFDAEVAELARLVEQHKLPVPNATLRSLDDMDGDFEMQAPAAGGSKGVLVAPWVYRGPIAVTTDAQSPFKHLYALGRVGATVGEGTNFYQMAQTLHPPRKRKEAGKVHLNLDFRISGSKTPANGRHRLWIGSRTSPPAAELIVSQGNLAIRVGRQLHSIRALASNQWHNLQLTLDLSTATLSGSAGQPGDITSIPSLPLLETWNGILDFVSIDSEGGEPGVWPTIAVDNLAIQDRPIAPVSRELPASNQVREESIGKLNERLQNLMGIDGDFELQTDAMPPVSPWGPGPNSVVKIQAGAQSPFKNHHPAGELGIHLPNSGDYNGFGQTLTNRWKQDSTHRLFASFDFRCRDASKGGTGSWRFYLGQGPGTSPAVELFFNGQEFYRRSGDQRDAVQAIKVGEWYQVQLVLDLKAKTYTGHIASHSGQTGFAGNLAAGWNGSIDYTFIDSYGHIGGVKPSLDSDNFVIGETSLAPLQATAVPMPGMSRDERRDKVHAIRDELAKSKAAAEEARKRLQSLLVQGPVELAYAVSEGTPQNSRLQMRGEPDRPGDEVPRGFVTILGGGSISDTTSGSGRLELANWITRPDNPLTARVMVNRLWQYHFGQGLVKTPNDFGTRGLPPTHPELLDYLATEFVARGWSLKAMHRLMMSSATYQQTSAGERTVPTETQLTGLPANHSTPPFQASEPHSTEANLSNSDLVTPFARRRLNAEEIRDTVLLVSGDLDSTPGQDHPFPSPTSWGYSQHAPYSGVYDHNRRSIYLMTQRIKRHPFLGLFDGADPNASTADRRPTTVPTQALFFLNDPFIHARAASLARQLRSAEKDEPSQIRTAYHQTFGRAATEVELSEAIQFLEDYRAQLPADEKEKSQLALAAFGRVLFGSNEFLTID
ncbi:MAG: DUF1553 domain-containing protein, partial [Verrucomicrobia bacterium]|nr:DUF1553 domain-containing protein [Verrucomicrobiota bacterium]